MSSDGTILAYRGENNNHDTVYGVVNTLDGSIKLIPTLDGLPSGQDPRTLILGLDGNLYLGYRIEEYNDETQKTEARFPWFRLSNDGAVISGIKVATPTSILTSGKAPHEYNYDWVQESLSGAPTGFTKPSYWNPNGRMVINGRVLYMDFGSELIFDVDIPNQRITGHDEVMGQFNHNRSIDAYPTDRHLWISGTSAETGAALIVRYNPATYEIMPLSFEHNFELHKFEPLDAETVMFEGVRLSDQSTIMGQMNIAGGIIEQTVYDAEQVPVTVLRAILPTDFIRIDGNPNDWDTTFRVLTGAANGPEGHDLVYYSEARGRGEYFGLIEFEGAIDNDGEIYTRINFDTHSIDIGSYTITVRESDNEAVDAFSTGASLATGTAVEFAIDETLLGLGSQPQVVSVERYALERRAAVRQLDYQYRDRSDGDFVEISLELDSPLGAESIKGELMHNEKLIGKLIISRESAVVVHEDSSRSAPATVEHPSSDDAGDVIRIAIPQSVLPELDLSDLQIFINQPAGVLAEQQLDILQ